MGNADTARNRLAAPERHKLVALRAAAGTSNRAIAKELGVDEGTIRNDLKYLATPEEHRPAKSPRPKRVKKPPTFHEMSLDQSQRHLKKLTKLAESWIIAEGFTLAEVEEFILPEAGKHLYTHRVALSTTPETTQGPQELLLLTRPNRTFENDMSAKLVFWAEWLARWLAVCLPREERLQEETLRQISISLRS